MKYILPQTVLLAIIAFSISCTQTHENNQGVIQTKDPGEIKSDTKETTSKKKSDANFIYVSEVSFYNDQSQAYSHLYTVFVENFDDKNENVWADMTTEALSKPYSTNGFTAVLFFNNKKYTPILKKGKGLDFDEKYDGYCIAGYWHYPSGKEEMKRYPLR